MTKFLIALFFLLFIGIVAGIYIFNLSQSTQPQVSLVPTSSPQTTLSFSPSSVSVIAGKAASVDIAVSAQGTAPTLIQLELAYDPTALGNIQITPGDFYSNPQIQLEKIDQSTGRISYAISALSSDIVKKQTGTVATISFTPYFTSFNKETHITFLPKTMTRSSLEQQNTLQTTKGTTVVITATYIPLTHVGTPSAH